MRNLKKILALVLALMMVLSVMVTASAADYSDADEIQYVEAVEVMSAIGVLQGTGNGFNPKGTLDRASAAKIITYIMKGGDLDSIESEALEQAFTDAATSWAANYINYIASEGIVDGNGAGLYYPKNTLTGYQFAKMLLLAAGVEGEYTGSGWELAVATAAKSNKLLTGLAKTFSLKNNISREEASQMAFNALSVSATGKTVYPIVDGDENEVAHFDTRNEAMLYLAILDNQNYKLGTAYVDSTGSLADTVFGLDYEYSTDDFGHTTKVWTASELKDCSVTLEVGVPAVTYTSATRASVIAKDLKGYTLDGVKVEADTVYTGRVVVPVYINGQDYEAFAANGANGCTPSELLSNQTGNGNVVEIYVNGTTKAVTKVVITSYQAATLDVATSKTTGDVTYTVAQNVAGTIYGDGETPATVVLNGEFADDDIVTYVVAGGNLYLYPTTQITGTITAKTSASVVTIGNAQYANGAYNTANYAVNPYSVDNYYLDQYGYIAYSDAVQVAASTDYLYAVEWDVKVTNSFNSYAPSVQVRAVLADGTVGVYTLDLDNYGGVWYCGDISLGTCIAADWNVSTTLADPVYGYVINEDGTLVLEELGTTIAANAVYTESANSVTPGATTASNSLLTGTTIYVVYNSTYKTAKVYTGAAALKSAYSALGTSYVIGTGLNGSVGNASVVFATTGTPVGAQVANYALVPHNSYVQTVNARGQDVYTYTGILTDGTVVELTTTVHALTTTGMYLYNTDGTIVDTDNQTAGTQAVAINLTNNNYGLASGSAQVVGSLLKIGNNYYNYADATVLELGYASLNADTAVTVIYEMAYVPGVGYSTTDIASILILE